MDYYVRNVMCKNELQSQVIDLLRFPMAVAVVVSHYGMYLAVDAGGIIKFLRLLSQLGARLAVPCFFFISGFLFYQQLHNWDWDVWKKKIRRRIRTLFLPYILYIIIAFFVYWLYALIQGTQIPIYQQFIQDGGMKIFWGTNGNIPLGPQATPLDGPLWFIRDLIYYSIASPLIFLFVVRTRMVGILALCMTSLVLPQFVPEGLVFFSIGAYLQIENKNILELVGQWKWTIYATALVLLLAIYFFFDYRRYIELFFILFGIGTSFGVAADFLKTGRIQVNPFLVRSSFFIFAIHEILILNEISIPLVLHLLPGNGVIWDCLRFLLTPAFAVLLCLLLLYLLERWMPRTISLLTGNRRSLL